jgi:23S rRNA pseudouridine1911/1915/1917 synthase
VKSSLALKGGDSIEVMEFPEKKIVLESRPVKFEVLYYDEHIIVIDKPSGLVVHPGAGNTDNTLANGLLYRFGKLPHVPDRLRPGIVHRLDKDTSGVLVAVRTPEAFEYLKAQFKNRETRKTYFALVHGVPRFTSNIIDEPVKAAVIRAGSMKMEIAPDGKPSLTTYETVEELGDYALLKVKPETGRTHQIRVHLAHIGHPVLCDPKYGRESRIMKSTVTKDPDDDSPLLDRLALHAHELSFRHPATEEQVVFSSPFPSELNDFREFMREFS